MKRTRLNWIVMIVCVLGVVLAGCGTTEPTWDAFEGALNEKSFPVPAEASSPDRATTNIAMDYVRYSLPGLKEKEGIPEPYLKAIKEWGWEEEKQDKNEATSRVFRKEESTVHLSVYDDYFIVMIPKDKKVSKGL